MQIFGYEVSEEQLWIGAGVAILVFLWCCYSWETKETFMAMFDKHHQWTKSHEIKGLRPNHAKLYKAAHGRRYGHKKACDDEYEYNC